MCLGEAAFWNPKLTSIFESQTPSKQGRFKAKVGSYGLNIQKVELQGKCPGGFI